MVDFKKLKEEQVKLAKKVITKDEFGEVKLVGGCDQGFFDGKVVSAVVVCELKSMKVVESKYAVMDVGMPYVPGFLGYRECPVIVEAFNKLEKRPEVLLCDFNGILHPRRIGAASHLGIILDIATIGVAKKLLLGEVKEEKIYVDKELRAVEFRAKEHANPVYISPGHKISLRSAVEIVKKCMREPHKLPEPLHLAHRYAEKLKKSESNINKL